MVEVYDSYLEHRKYQHFRKKAVIRCYIRRQSELKQKTGNLIVEQLQRRVEAMMKEQQHSEIQSKIKILKEKLAIQRERFDKLKLELERKMRLEEERAKKELELKQKSFEQHAEVVKNLAIQFKEAKTV